MDFRFKQFTIQHDHAAMKVGTDGVLLGAWANTNTAKYVLDIGTGTGLIALMAAQRNHHAQIVGIDIDTKAIVDAKYNAANCKWKERINMIQGDIIQFQTNEKFDFIISNPPFFKTGTNINQKNRATARYTDSLNFLQLIQSFIRLLQPNGKAALIVPYSDEQEVVSIARKHQLFPHRMLRVRGNEKAPLKRSLIEFSFDELAVNTQELTIELERHQYTKEYQDLVRDFYLNL